MAITNGYCTLAELKAWLDIGDTDDDTQLEATIEAASRWIDNKTGRRFYSATETRYYTADNSYYLYVDDIARDTATLANIIAITTDGNADGTHETAWTASDYILMPANAQQSAASEIPAPYTSLEVNKNTGDYLFPVGVQNGVKIQAAFGYGYTIAPDINQACLMLASRFWKRKDAIFGIAGAANLGVQIIQASIPQDNDIMSLLRPFVRHYG